MSLREFGSTARKLTHNPLGIIALFIVLVYAFASLVVGLGANLDQTQKTPLIWFLVLFPVLVLLVFAWLVSHHHTKLYAPTDYRDERLFISPISAEEQRLRLQDEADAIQTTDAERTAIQRRPTEPSPERSALPSSTARKSAVSKYLLAEDLALRQLEADLGVPIARQVKLELPGARILLDGLIRDDNQYTCIEVKYVATPERSLPKLQNSLMRLDTLVTLATHIKVRFMFVVVTEFSGDELDRFMNRITQGFSTSAVPIEWRFYNFSDLKQKFGITEEQA